MTNRKVALVAGGSGGIGEGIVAALVKNGYRVYVPTREGDSAEALRSLVRDETLVHTVPADLSDEKAINSLRERILDNEAGLDAVVVSVGSYYYGYRMHRMPRKDFDQSIQDNLVTHFNLQRTFVDLLRSQGRGVYATLTGPEADSIHPDESVMSIMAAAQKMMTRVLAQEAFDSDVRVHSITAHTSIKTRKRGDNTNADWISAEDLGAYVVALIDGRIPGANQVVHELRNREHVKTLLKRAM